eukprot:CAMPEP_0181083350 /NCGR_PEP_ID=MMETSP1071-20121207/4110_1 /TAXON_ID=35127 /ORGANISM="Thalassiosira sp., Strain NH16" /LENGTH=229 /DNA_ID=CAMNT_0023165001 /DNA_START=108 /DNA_END=797 /DNA_ORIENTATION=-
MISKAFVASILSFSVITCAASAPKRRLRQNDRELQASLGCLINRSASQCCPSASPTDGICTVLWCLNPDDMTVNDGCTCEQITRSCNQLSGYQFLVAGLSESCEGARQCCGSRWSRARTTNAAYNSCMGAKVDRGMAVPNFDSFFPKGIPNLSGTGDKIAFAPTLPPKQANAKEEPIAPRHPKQTNVNERPEARTPPPKKMNAQEKPNIEEAMSLPYGADNDGPTRLRY